MESNTRSIERKIVKQCIADMLAAGFRLSVNDGKETTLRDSADPEQVLNAMFTTDKEWIIGRRLAGKGVSSWVRFVYGNDGPDVINDYSTDLEPHLTATLALADSLDT